MREEKLSGVVTGRDAVLRTVADGGDLKRTTMREVLPSGVVFDHADEVEAAPEKMEEYQILAGLADLVMWSNFASPGCL